ncbi:MAG TPA: DegT/DnrJ/EryC1/StrS family aminotransferase [Sandaracinaceae bacterium LLY-WYZ-13_1]|nr:DegT/DnrJ/EryC1/StrS family aminotransferase [Sandaracinaceae bacterium LLY-WYZ-13_1]
MSANELAILGGAPVLGEDEHRTWPIVEGEEREAVMAVLERGILSGGDAPEARAFERAFADFVGTKHALLTHSGTSALQVAVAAVGVQPGDEVLMPAYSFVATPLCVLAQGGLPRFVDVDPETGNMDPERVERSISARTKAIMPVHVHGCPADMDPILAIAERHGLAVIEDAAQAHGATYRGRGAGTMGAAAGFSLQSSKNLSAGEGGVFVTDDDALMERANQVRNFGQDLHLADRAGYDPARPLDGGRALTSLFPGHMFRGNEMMAAFARAQLAKLPARTAAAQRNAEVLREGLDALEGVHLQRIPEDRTTVWHKVRVHFDPAEAGLDLTPRELRSALTRALTAEGANAVLWQDHALPEHPVFARFVGYGHEWPFLLHEDPAALHATYEADNFPHTRALLDSSVVLFSQSRPLIAQTAAVVERYVEAFHKVWSRRDALVTIAHEA